MIMALFLSRWRALMLPGVCLLTGGELAAAPAGPTLFFDYGSQKPIENALVKFMYFVPLISPEPVVASTDAGNTQAARVISLNCRTNGSNFRALCEFEILGSGLQRNVFDHEHLVQRHEQELKSGKTLSHQLASINVEGAGSGTVEIEGIFSNSIPVVREMRMHFNSRDHASPVTVTLHDISYRKGSVMVENDTVARVNMLVFCEKAGSPKMEITLASVKPEKAGNGFWQNALGKVRGAVANVFIHPLAVPADGHRAMMDFGLALATHQGSFTFPLALRLKDTTTVSAEGVLVGEAQVPEAAAGH